MQEPKYSELEERASQASLRDEILQIEGRSRVRHEIELMKAEGKALTLSDEEVEMLHAFRRFKLRMRRNGEVFTWQSSITDGVQIVEETAEIVHPNES